MTRTPRIALVPLVLLLAGPLVGLTGCRTVRPEPTETYRPLYDKAEVRSQLQRSRRIAEKAEGVEQAVARAAVELWEALEALYAAPPEVPADAVEREAAIVSAYLRQVEAASRASEPATPVEEGEPTTVELTFLDFFDALAAAEADGRFEDAIAVGEQLIEALDERGGQPLMATRLRLSIGLWHLALGQYDEARAAFEAVQAARTEGDTLAERARLLAEELDLLQTLPAGPDRDDLARGWALLESGQPEQAGALARAVQQRAEDADLQREASFLVAAVQRESAAWIKDLERRARADLADGPPYEVALQCAAELAGGPEPAPTHAREIRVAVEEAEAGELAHLAATLQERWARSRKEADALIAAEKLEAAVALYESFADTAVAEQARVERLRVVDILVREERRRAGDLFVAAQKERGGAAREALLEEAAAILGGLLEDYPESSYADRVRKNLAAVEEALAADPG